MRQPGAGFVVVARVDVTVEAVAGIVDVEPGVGLGAAVGVDVGLGNALVAGAEVEQHRRLQRLAEEGHGARAVIAHRRQAEPGIGQVGDAATPPEADHADAGALAGRLLGQQGAQLRRRGLDDGHRAVEAQGRGQGAPAFEAGFVIGQLGVAFDRIEQGGCQGQEAVARVALRDRADVGVDAEDLLDHHQAAQRRGLRPGQPAADAADPGNLEPDARTHRCLRAAGLVEPALGSILARRYNPGAKTARPPPPPRGSTPSRRQRMNDTAPSNATRVGFVSLGCPKALVDSERILTQRRVEGYDLSSSYDAADVVVVNTCGFIDSAVAESLDAIGEAMAENGKVIVTGCLGKRADVIREAHPGVLSISGPQDYASVMDAVHAALPPRHDPFVDLMPAPRLGAEDYADGVKLTPKHYAYLKISEGCNHRCSFCIIPSMRGDLVSRP